MKNIETKIAKNGVKIFFAVDENGKKTRISAKEAAALESSINDQHVIDAYNELRDFISVYQSQGLPTVKAEQLFIFNTLNPGNHKALFDMAQDFRNEVEQAANTTAKEITEVKAETASVPEDSFKSKLAALKAEYDKAEQVTADKKAALAKAEEEYHDAAKRSAAALQDLQILCANVERQLDQDLLADFPLSSEMEITALDGQSYKTKFTEPYFVFGDIGENISLMVFKDASNIPWKFAAYDTPDQMKVAIAMLKDAVARGDKEFTFPTADELNAVEPDGYEFTVLYKGGEAVVTKCEIFGDADHFDNSVYRELMFYHPDDKIGWRIHTADGKLVAAGIDEHDIYKFLATKANVEPCSDNRQDKPQTPTADAPTISYREARRSLRQLRIQFRQRVNQNRLRR